VKDEGARAPREFCLRAQRRRRKYAQEAVAEAEKEA
jgi:hypothetical protein